jgi:hypothetical protein
MRDGIPNGDRRAMPLQLAWWMGVIRPRTQTRTRARTHTRIEHGLSEPRPRALARLRVPLVGMGFGVVFFHNKPWHEVERSQRRVGADFATIRLLRRTVP